MVSDWRVYWHKLTRVKWRLVGYGPADETDSRQTCYVVLYCLWTYRLHWMHYLTCIARYSFVWVTSCILYACVDSRGVFMMKIDKYFWVHLSLRMISNLSTSWLSFHSIYITQYNIFPILPTNVHMLALCVVTPLEYRLQWQTSAITLDCGSQIWQKY